MKFVQQWWDIENEKMSERPLQLGVCPSDSSIYKDIIDERFFTNRIAVESILENFVCLNDLDA